MDTTIPLRKGDKVLVEAIVASDQFDPGSTMVRIRDDYRDLYVGREVIASITAPVIEKGETVSVNGRLYEFIAALDDEWAVIRDHPEDVPAVVSREQLTPIRKRFEPLPQVALEPPAVPAPDAAPHAGRSE